MSAPFKRSAANWLNAIRHIHEQSFGYHWAPHLAELNRTLGLEGEQRLCLPLPGCPPAWFNGNIEKIVPRRWVLFVSLNPQLPGPEIYEADATPAGWWSFWLTHNRDHWYGRFFSRPVAVASMVLGADAADYQTFATEQMVFVESCPYASSAFSLSHDAMAQLASADLGFLLGRRVMELLVSADPAAIFVNGSAALRHFADSLGEAVTWGDEMYASPDDPQKKLWHRQGSLLAGGRRIPLIGFPFLGAQRTHNSHREVEELGRRARLFVDAFEGTAATQ